MLPRFGPSPLATLSAALLFTVGLLISGCAMPDLNRELPIADPQPFSESGVVERPEIWWTAFDDDDLNHHLDVAFEANFSLEAAWERVLAARALTWRRASDLWPDLNGTADARATFLPGSDPSLFALGLGASYEPDIWGRIRSQVEAEGLRAAATEEDYQWAALQLSGEIASVWYALAEAHAQYELVEEQIKTNEQGLELMETRFGFGQNRSADVLRQRQLVESTREQLVVVQSRIEQLEHQFAVLLGQTPQGANYEAPAVLPQLPPLPATGLPSELIQRRPDVRRDYDALMAADRDVASAVSNQFPRLNLTASLETAAENPEGLFRDWILGLAGQLTAPLFDGGQRRAEVHRTAAVTRQRIAQYGQTVLVAFQEVENALAREKYAQQRLAYVESQIELGEQTVTQLVEGYFTGVSDYLSVLTATTNQQRLQRQYLSIRLELVLARIELYRSLSGNPLTGDSLPGVPASEMPPPPPDSIE
jgi:NodT family efflux transporter outer membrane factor (OMF) lipoprotein